MRKRDQRPQDETFNSWLRALDFVLERKLKTAGLESAMRHVHRRG